MTEVNYCGQCGGNVITGHDSSCSTQKVKLKTHEVEIDYVGLNGRERLSCYSPGCNDATLVRQPYMTLDQWKEKMGDFLKVHPCDGIVNAGWRG